MATDSLRLVFRRPDGAISVDAPVVAIASDSDALAAHVARLEGVHGWQHVGTLDAADLPAYRRFRAAWRWAGGRVGVDVEAARDVLLAEVRADRDRRLAASDGAMVRALESGDRTAKAAWKAYREALRDLPAVVAPLAAGVVTVADLSELVVQWPVRPDEPADPVDA